MSPKTFDDANEIEALLADIYKQFGDPGLSVLSALQKLLSSSPTYLESQTGFTNDGWVFVVMQGRDLRNNIWAGDLRTGKIYPDGVFLESDPENQDGGGSYAV